MFFWYKNSVLATIISFVSATVIVTGIYAAVDGELSGLALAVIGVPGMILAGWINNRASFRKWYKQRDPVVDDQVRVDRALAKELYTAMPNGAMLSYIRSLNPAAAAELEASKKK